MPYSIRGFHAALFAAVILAGSLARPAAADDGSGQAFTLHVRPGSAAAAFREAAGALRGDRLKNLIVRSALSDRRDRFVQAFVSAQYGGTPVVGVLFAGADGIAGGVIDTADRLPRSYPSLLQRLQRLLPAPPGAGGRYAPQPLHAVSFGSGTIGLPATWQVTGSYQGCVEAVSQQDHGYIGLGCPQTGVIPPGLPGADPRVLLIAPYSNPVQMLGEIGRRLNLESLHPVEVQQIDSGLPHGQAAYILFDYQIRGVPFRGLAMINMAPVDQMSYVVFKSMFMLPANSFARLAPTMWRSWQSWGVDRGVLTGRMVAAAQSMRETGALISGANASTQRASSSAAAGFDQYIRDAATVEHIDSGARAEGSAFSAQAIVDRDPTKFRIVPASELLR
ncbi:MAG: hypothetical protein M3M96_04290 [Candidatus Eremiobacteraeota bacterium]|nr:hypothetical protein [Candidatus Eremiobacteraeota bacterium]